MKRLATALAAAWVALALGAAPAGATYPAQGNFGLHSFDVSFTDKGGEFAGAGSHPFALTTSFGTNLDAEESPEGRIRDVFIEQVLGLLGDTTAYETCPTLQFLIKEENRPTCPRETVVGIEAASLTRAGQWAQVPVFNITPPPGVLLRFGFSVAGANVFADVSLSPEPPHVPVASSRNTSQILDVFGNKLQLWGDPSDPAHDELRGKCGERSYEVILPPEDIEGFEFKGTGEKCPVEDKAKPLLTMPTTCAEPLATRYEAFSWEGDTDAGAVLTHNSAGAPEPLFGCEALASFAPSITARPTSRAAESPTGLDFSLDVEDPGLVSLGEDESRYSTRSQSAIRKAVVTLPEGMTANPSLAEGLEVCSEADLGRETLSSAPGAGCPQASKIGRIEVESPLVSEPVHGALYQAEPFANLADDALIAFYIVLKNPRLGILVKQTTKVEADPRTGQLLATADDIPQLAFSHFRLKFREGGRSPLVSPPVCGRHEVKAVMTPWSGGPPTTDTSAFEILSGPNGGPCPPGGVQPFEPGFDAGTANNAAGHYSPFSMRLTRRDGDQDLTRFDAILPKGALARLAGVSRCPEAQIALAKAKSGRVELRSPSCPLNSRIGRVISGAGVGSQLTYVPGTVYLAGPVGGAPLSVVGIVPAVAGPFDIGTIVVRQALDLNPITGVAEVDGAASDPIPHILAGIPLRVRDIQVHVDRPGFTLNPTNCNPMAALAGIWGGGQNVFSRHDDSPVLRSARFQAASCASLGFKPRLAIRLFGGPRRGDNPALRAIVRPRPGEANFSRAVVTLPRSAFLDQGHIRTICTRVQFAAGAGHGSHCPPAARYGTARAWSPLLDGPVQGPVYLRSSNNRLPDLVAALAGPPSARVQVELSARIDSVRGGIRSVFTGIPDVPVSRFMLHMQGGNKGLIVNSRNLCVKPKRNRARVNLRGQNGRFHRPKPRVVSVRCAKRRQAERRRAKRARAGHMRASAGVARGSAIR